jgi:hypothetical protein
MQAVGLDPERPSHRGPQGAQALWRLLNDRVGEMLALVATQQGDTLRLAVLPKIITGSMKLLARRGVLVEVEGSTSIANNDSASDEARTLRPLQAAPCQGPGPWQGTNSPLHCSCPGSAAQARVRDRHAALPKLRRPAQDHRGDPASAGDREDPHAAENSRFAALWK